MSEFISCAEAYRLARERASVADSFEATLLHMAVYDAREAGMSIREVAAALSVPKSTVARHWRDGHRCPEVVPVWGSAAAWGEAHAAIWAHNPRELADDWVPFEWRDEAGSRVVRRRARGVATLREWPVQAPVACAGGICGHCEKCRARQEQADQ
ncbi:hypothetical protein GU243_23285 (plasmid) [Pseudarthrobacter psychrotolerans]|uniref:Uncharacterized protein n=1 Tax=Pseudarthrobacter psychrotolerans TaxID=2697569 RepID=A0A6P1NRT3_9MICC|nr:hypothetical protein [Pseudarthrobacter psychrotolerans]QHK22499.1 hypothetical protein GU243_23285 [Pseudarthrobacter psychrotolerans]